MKKLYFLFFTILISGLSFGQEAVITGYVDSPCPGALGRTVEIYVDGTVDFTGWSLDRQANGGGYTTSFDLSSLGTLTDEFAYVTNDATILNNEFGITTNVIINSGITDNGDDAFQLFDGTNVIDRFGEDGVDGTGTAWEHVDTYYYRLDGTPANGGTFVVSDFTFGAQNLLDLEGLCNLGNSLSTLVPFASYSTIPNTTPSLKLNNGPLDGSVSIGNPEDVNASIDFITTNFTMSMDAGGGVSDSSGDGYIEWAVTNMGMPVDSGNIFTSNDGFEYPITGLVAGNTYVFFSELVDNAGASLIPAVTYSFTITIPAYIDVATIADLRAGTVDPDTYYRVTGEVINTYSRSNRNQKYFQDATGGILVDDANFEISSTYNEGDGITNIRGNLSVFNGVLQFVPTPADWGAATSTGNTVTIPTVDIATLSTTWENYESELVRINGVTFADGNGANLFSSSTSYEISDGSAMFFRTTFSEADYIGQTIPVGSTNIVGIVGEVSGVPNITARTLSELTLSTKNNQIQGFALYPNPTSLGYVTMASKNNANMNVAVFDILGKQVLNKKVSNNTLDVSHLKSGVYIMKVSQDNASVTKKLVIQ